MMLTTALTCLALNIYHEGRGETELGKKIIAQTVMNRAGHNDANVCREVMKPYQYSWTNRLVAGRQLKTKGKPQEKDSWETCQTIAKQALNGKLDLPKKYRNATHFHTPRVQPNWTSRMVRLGQVDGHIYYQAKTP
ncbi:TPA: cell wall hydrolase [Acinetobacter baumannii]|nr:cell wall hydrolase [Acinetobacter baumannii]